MTRLVHLLCSSGLIKDIAESSRTRHICGSRPSQKKRSGISRVSSSHNNDYHYHNHRPTTMATITDNGHEDQVDNEQDDTTGHPPQRHLGIENSESPTAFHSFGALECYENKGLRFFRESIRANRTNWRYESPGHRRCCHCLSRI